MKRKSKKHLSQIHKPLSADTCQLVDQLRLDYKRKTGKNIRRRRMVIIATQTLKKAIDNYGTSFLLKTELIPSHQD